MLFAFLLLLYYAFYVFADCPIVSNYSDRRPNSSKYRFVRKNHVWLFEKWVGEERR
jgi:hypothetical protein